MFDNQWDKPTNPGFRSSKWGRYIPKPENTQLTVAQLSVSSIVSSMLNAIISFAMAWLFGQLWFPENAPVLSLKSWMQQYPLVSILIGAAILVLVLILLQKRNSRIAKLMRALTKTRTRVLALAGSALIFTAVVVTLLLLFPSDFVYTAFAPGPGCTSEDTLWKYRTDATTLTCTNHGTDLTVTPGTTLGEVSFDPRTLQGAGSLQTYCVQVTATFVTAGADVAAVIGVHGQNPGGQAVEFSQGGSLTIVRFTHEQGVSIDPPLYVGSFQATSPFRLAVGVDGSHISVWVNKTPVGAISDSTYTTTDYVILGLGADADNPATATFSDFMFHGGSIAGCGS